ncbi:MAG: hypothetical protein M1150_01470 [Patescibacteria group bacterium]|nr:hypothetical protein [Patescibacteria group bacterium]
MVGYFLKHVAQFFLLIIALSAALFVLNFTSDLFWRTTMIFAISAGYLGYGTAHHQEEKNLNFSTLLEYLFIALIALITLYAVFVR